MYINKYISILSGVNFLTAVVSCTEQFFHIVSQRVSSTAYTYGCSTSITSPILQSLCYIDYALYYFWYQHAHYHDIVVITIVLLFDFVDDCDVELLLLLLDAILLYRYFSSNFAFNMETLFYKYMTQATT